MNHELEWSQRRRHRLNPDSGLRPAWDKCFVSPEMARAGRRTLRHRSAFAVERPHQYLLSGNPVECEPARIAPLKFGRKPLAARPVPHDLSRREAFPDRVQDVE